MLLLVSCQLAFGLHVIIACLVLCSCRGISHTGIRMQRVCHMRWEDSCLNRRNLDTRVMLMCGFWSAERMNAWRAFCPLLLCLRCTSLCSCRDFFLQCVLVVLRALLYIPASIALAVPGGPQPDLLDHARATTIGLDGHPTLDWELIGERMVKGVP